MNSMSYMEKIDVLDLIIEVLKEHEKALDSIIFKLDTLLNADEKKPKLPNLQDRGTSMEKWR